MDDWCLDGYKDDGTGNKCIAFSAQCSVGYHDDGSGQNCIEKYGRCAN